MSCFPFEHGFEDDNVLPTPPPMSEHQDVDRMIKNFDVGKFCALMRYWARSEAGKKISAGISDMVMAMSEMATDPDVPQHPAPMAMPETPIDPDLAQHPEPRMRKRSEAKVYRNCTSPQQLTAYWTLRHTSADTPRPTPIKYKSREERKLARVEKRAQDEARRARKAAVREKSGEKDENVMVV